MEQEIIELKEKYGDLAINVAEQIANELEKVDRVVNSYHLTEAVIYWKRIVELLK